MNNEEKLSKLSAEKFKEHLGVSRETFGVMLKILELKYTEEHALGGRKPSLNVLDRLLVSLTYLREYRTMGSLAFEYGVSKTAIHNAIKWVENILVKSPEFALPSKRILERGERVKITIADVTEQEIERPKRGRKNGIRERKSGTQ